MMKVTRLILAGLSLGMLAACETPAGLELGKAQRVTPAGSAFNNALYGEYMERAAHEQAENHHYAADVFARKAMAAARNELVLPEEPYNYDLPPLTVPEITEARARLVDVLDRGGREALPAVAAHAQRSFDCWVEEQDENIQPPHIAACREAFYAALGRVEPLVAAAEPGPAPIRPAMVVPTAMPAPMPAPVMARSFLVFFDWDKADLTPEALNIVRKAADSAEATGAAGINVTGHADKSGPDPYNIGLSMRRAEAVKRELVRQGISGNTVDLSARGERDPLVPTPDGVREPQNRRAEIILK